jgi:hypothetical protein
MSATQNVATRGSTRPEKEGRYNGNDKATFFGWQDGMATLKFRRRR